MGMVIRSKICVTRNPLCKMAEISYDLLGALPFLRSVQPFLQGAKGATTYFGTPSRVPLRCKHSFPKLFVVQRCARKNLTKISESVSAPLKYLDHSFIQNSILLGF